jgi:hypothetical protein
MTYDALLNWIVYGGQMPNLAEGIDEVAYPVGFEPGADNE